MITQKMDISYQAPSGLTVSEPRTRSGRVSKPPERYSPIEQVEDDYGSDDYDSAEISDVSSTIETDSEEEDDESDADEYGNLNGFVVPDKSESAEDDTDGESSVSSNERAAPQPRKPRDGGRVAPATPTSRRTRSRLS